VRAAAIERARHLARCFEGWRFGEICAEEGITDAERVEGARLAAAQREDEFMDYRVQGSPEYGSKPQTSTRKAPARPVESAAKPPKIAAA